MKTKISFIYIVLTLIFCVSCDKNEVLPGEDFVGSYSMNTTIVTETILGYDTSMNTLPSDVEIYRKERQLYIQTEIFGIPNSELPLELPSSKQRLVCLEDSTQETTIEDVVGPDAGCIIMKNGILFCFRDGMYRKPYPILVPKIYPYTLSFCNSDTILVPLTDADAQVLATSEWYYQYGDINYSKTCFSWDVELSLLNKRELDSCLHMNSEIVRIIYHNILVRK